MYYNQLYMHNFVYHERLMDVVPNEDSAKVLLSFYIKRL